ncbi:hypothetical protein HOLleu_22827 [Holothuria leucospilota]|uniref:Uncharacterized protein n=1 Tax=Holothuria leucospilota TaxID=206669 RepID=A0A9Q1BTW1_HOLLE|nr:hypothetical protein HOLleu_22827 [Holothuria leucospilota]
MHYQPLDRTRMILSKGFVGFDRVQVVRLTTGFSNRLPHGKKMNGSVVQTRLLQALRSRSGKIRVSQARTVTIRCIKNKSNTENNFD